MDDGFEIRGHWWLPDTPEHRVAGTLTFNADGGGQLGLLGLLADPYVERPGDKPGIRLLAVQSRTYPRVLGESLDGELVELGGTFATSVNRNWLGDTAGSETLHVNHLLRGIHFDDVEQPVADGVYADLLHLPYWTGRTGLHTRHHDGPHAPGDGIFDVLGARTETPRFRPRAGVTGQVQQQLTTTGDGIVDRGLHQTQIVAFTGRTLRPVQEWIDLVTSFQHLVSIGMNRTAVLQSIAFTHPDLDRRPRSGRPVRHRFSYHAQWTDRDGWTEPRRRNDDEILFDLADLGGERAFRRWFDAAELHRLDLARVMHTRYSKTYRPADRLMARAAALEGFARRRHAGGRFAQRIDHCIALAGEPFHIIAPNPIAWRDRLASERHDVAHNNDDLATASGFHSHLMAEAAYYLFVLCMLRAAEARTRVFDRAVTNRDVKWIGEQLAAAGA